ncbi:MAG: alpha/beta hydrolase [Ilumatobacteraceae bacterium]
MAEDLLLRTRDGRELFAVRAGGGAPTVVFEAGMGGSHHMWGGVFPGIADITTAVAYDRSGLGRSPADPAPRNLQRLVDDLVDVLGQLGDGPFVLVGHSWGGPIVRCAAAAMPERIAGLVLVDPTDEGANVFFSDGNARMARIGVKLSPAMARLGVYRLVTRRLAKKLPEESARGLRAEDGTVAAVRTQCAEMAPSIDDLRRLRAEPPTPPDVPLTVISGAVSSKLERGRRGEVVTAHRVRARMAAANGHHVMAERSGHMVPFTEPGLVIDEIARVVDLARGGADVVAP